MMLSDKELEDLKAQVERNKQTIGTLAQWLGNILGEHGVKQLGEILNGGNDVTK